MTVRNLDGLFRPRSAALIGPPTLVGDAVAQRFQGPRAARAGDLATAPDLAVLSTSLEAAPGEIAALGAAGTRGVMLLSEQAPAIEGAEGLRQALLDAARPNLVRLLGPNSLGLMVPAAGLEVSLLGRPVRKGRVALVVQANSVLGSVLDWAEARGIGFSTALALGESLDVDIGDVLDWLAVDRATDVILLHLHAADPARKFMSAARAAARVKPVVAIKAGRDGQALAAAATHSRRMVGHAAVFDAALQRAGILQVRNMAELLESLGTVALGPAPAGNRLAILSNGGGTGVLAADALLSLGGTLAALSQATQAALAALPGMRGTTNPVDLGNDATPALYAQAARLVAADRGVDAVLVLNAPSLLAQPTDAAEAIIAAWEGVRHPRLLTCWLGAASSGEARARFAARGIPSFETPTESVRGFLHLAAHRRAQDLLLQAPPSIPEAFAPDLHAAQALVAEAMAQGRTWLGGADATALLDCYRIPTNPVAAVRNADAAAREQARLGRPVALKIRSRDVMHKRASGGVALGLVGPFEVRRAARDMLKRVAANAPEAVLEGFTVEPMVERANGVECLVGMIDDPVFGPAIVFGHGGTAVEVIGDRALCLPPLNMMLARDCIAQTRVARLLAAYPGKPEADLQQVALTLVKVAQMVTDLPEIAELEVNPLLVDEHGVIVLDARIRLAPPRLPRGRRLAIRPYPKELEEEIQLADGSRALLRPIVPEDATAMNAGFAKVKPEHVRLRFFSAMKELSLRLAARLTQIDYDREMALVVVRDGLPGQAEWLGSVRIVADPDNERAEYAVLVRSDMAGRGLGTLLMQKILDYAKARGIREVYGEVLRENTGMLKLAEELGFRIVGDVEDPSLCHVSLSFPGPAGG
ncbi:bifunctional acetate--CoA ligase family protein/GNAT family N-acetyltransferase [Zavarzinia sp. CC-PAN008]|uniref:bifunctional acetate--CoA ligase family protein/GNAT family N-acetyltransferase n=1 Tax=Zavarzinia sp. CC-PAN008 TaxID=3243332 RepID=UPI003F7442E1